MKKRLIMKKHKRLAPLAHAFTEVCSNIDGSNAYKRVKKQDNETAYINKQVNNNCTQIYGSFDRCVFVMSND